MIINCKDPVKAIARFKKPDKPSMYRAIINEIPRFKEERNRALGYPKMPYKGERQETINFLNKLFYGDNK